MKKQTRLPRRRPSYELPKEYVAMLEILLGQALQSNLPVKNGIEALVGKLKLQGPYLLRLRAAFEPDDRKPDQPAVRT